MFRNAHAVLLILTPFSFERELFTGYIMAFYGVQVNISQEI